MNARQKAKKLKKEAKKLKEELDFIKNKPVRDMYKVINVESEHLRAYRIFGLDEIERLGEEFIENEARHQLSTEFIKFIRENMIVNKERDLDRFNTMKYSTDIWVGFERRV